MVGQYKDLICSENQQVELKEMVDPKPYPTEENVDLKGGGISLLWYSQIYVPKYEVSDANSNGIPILTGNSMKIKATTEVTSKKKTLAKLSDTLHPTTSMEVFMQAMKSSGTIS